MEGKEFDLEGVPVRVTNVNFDGLQRTKGDFLSDVVNHVFQSKTFGELITRVGQAQTNLQKLEIFRDVSTLIDIDKDDDLNSGDGYHVTFVVKELSRIAASVKTQMGAQADTQIKTGLRMPNLLGRGEKLEVEYSYSSNNEKNSEISFMKPVLRFPDSNWKATIFQSKSAITQIPYLNSAVGSLLTFYFPIKDKQLRNVHHRLEYEGTWREITPTNSVTPLVVRKDCGHSFKSAIRHIVTVDGRDEPIFPSSGTYGNFLQEIAGLFGDVKYYKTDLDLQHNIPLPYGMVLQSSFRMGLIKPFGSRETLCGIADKFFSGGPYSLRGFEMRGINRVDGVSVGNLVHWSSAIHLYTHLPYLNKRYPMVENCRLHFFANAGNLADKLLSENIFKELRMSYGMGIAVGLGNFGRLEVNYCYPVKYEKSDACKKGIQVGIGVQFL